MSAARPVVNKVSSAEFLFFKTLESGYLWTFTFLKLSTRIAFVLDLWVDWVVDNGKAQSERNEGGLKSTLDSAREGASVPWR